MSTQAHDSSKAPSNATATPRSSQFESRPFEQASVTSAFAPVTNQFQSRPFAAPSPQSPSQQAAPDIQTQLEQAKHFNYDLSEINLFSTGTTPPEPPPSPVIQPKLTIGEPGDKYEQEADSVAAQVMSMSASPTQSRSIQRQGDEDEQEPSVQKTPLADSITPLVQCQTEEKEEPIQTQSLLQRAVANGNPKTGGNLESQLNSSKGGGNPLPNEVRSFMEPRFGADFSQVRVHTDSTAVQMNKELSAQAFAHGSDIYYGAGKSPSNNELTAHELTHTIQQTGGLRLNKEVRRQAKPEEEEKGQLQAKKLRDRIPKTSPYKELRLQPLEEQEDAEPLQAKVLPGYTPEFTFNKELRRQPLQTDEETLQAKKLPDDTSDLKHLKTNPEDEPEQIPPVKEASERQPEVTPESAKAPSTHPQTTESAKESAVSAAQPTLPESVAVDKGAASEAKAESAPESMKSETGESGQVKVAAEQAPAQTLPAPDVGTPPEAQAVPPVPQDATAKMPQVDKPSPEAQSVAGATPATESIPQSTESAMPIESGGGSAEESAGMEAAGGEEEEIAALAAEAPPGSAQLESSDRETALASLQEGAEGGEAVGGGGGGGAAIPDKPAPLVPAVSQSEPSAALAAVSHLPPAQLLGALGGVGAAVGTSVGKQRAELAANPPQMERPTGSPMTSEGSAADRSMPSGKNPKAVAKTPEGQAKPVPQPKPVALSSAPPVAKVPQPQVKRDAQGKLDAGDAHKLQASLRSLPTSDPGLQQVSASAPPRLELQGNADPQQAQQQRGELEKGIADAHSKGQQELAQPMGENEIYPKVPQETLRAEGIGGGGGAAGDAAKAAGGAEAGDEAVSIIAQQEHSQEIQAGVAKAQAEIAGKRQEHSAKVEEEKARSHQEITKLQTENSAQQAAERTKAQAEVQQQRSAWQKEQDALITKSRKDADEAVSKGNKDVQQEQTQAETKASEHIKKGEDEAAEARRQGEQEAEKERQKGEQDSGGIFGWLADKAKAFFDGIKQAIQKAFEVARAAVKAAIEGAQKLATAVIETARQAIVGIIKAVGAALIAIGDVLLAAFPEIRDRFRNAIKGVVKAAETAVNALADTLKKGVQAALNLLGKGLDAALGLLEKGMLAAVDIAKTAVQGAIKLADAAIKAMAAFAVLVKDIAGNPGQWLSNLGAGAMDGIKNHFWGAFQTAVKEWFNQKVEEVLGLGMTIWNVLKQGGINLPEVAKMAWEGIKSAIPGVLIQLLIEKVVSMIVPAAGTVMVIIEGLQAAWGTVSRILQAFERFMAFLKAVKTGQAGPPFGAALATAGVVVIDFVSNWLLKRLRGPASKVAGKFREIATKIGNKIKNVVKKLGKKFGKLKDKLFGKKGGKGDKNKGHGHEGDRDRKGSKENKEDKDRKNQEKLDRAVAALKPKVHSLLQQGVSGIRLRAQLAIWRVQYRLSALSVDKQGGDRVQIIAKVNPEKPVEDGYQPQGDSLHKIIRQVVRKILNRKDVKAAAKKIDREKTVDDKVPGRETQTIRHTIPEKEGWPGLVNYLRKREPLKPGTPEFYKVGMSQLTQGQTPALDDIQVPQLRPPFRGGDFVTKRMAGGKQADLGRYHRRNPNDTNETIVDLLQQMRQRGKNDKDIAAAMQTLIRKGGVKGFHHDDAKTLGSSTMLMFGVEAARNPATVAIAPMLTELVASGKMTWQQAIDAFPMSPPKDAVKIADTVNSDLGFRSLMANPNRPKLATPDQVRESKGREEQIVIQWLQMKMNTEKPVFDSERDARNYIEGQINKFYGLGFVK